MRYLTHLGGATTTVLIGLALLVVPATRTTGFLVLVANASSHLAVQILKRTVTRARPVDPLGQPLADIPWPDPYSFPSGHAAAATAVSVTISLRYPEVAVVVLPVGLLVALSRVTLRVHHLSDVFAGALLGLAGALFATLYLV